MIDKVVVENINVPGCTSQVSKIKYSAMKEALLAVLPIDISGITQKEMLVLIQPHLLQDLFPEGAKSGWWMKTVQLDLEAKGVTKRNNSKPLTWYRL
ncbi:MAG: hypothetical protein AAEF23_02500 [Gammaproteobacteria bacterium]